MHRKVLLAFAVLPCLAAVAQAAPTIIVGNYTFTQNTGTHQIAIYATGTAWPTRLTLHSGRRLVRPGEYMLTLTRQLGHRRLQTHQEITIG